MTCYRCLSWFAVSFLLVFVFKQWFCVKNASVYFLTSPLAEILIENRFIKYLEEIFLMFFELRFLKWKWPKITLEFVKAFESLQSLIDRIFFGKLVQQ